MDLSRLPANFKVVRTDRELEMSMVDEALRQWGAQLVILPDGTPAEVLTRELADADVLLMCYAKITRPMLQGATRLKAIVKYGVGIDAIDIDTARERGIPVVNVPAYAEETVAEGALSLLMGLFKRFKPKTWPARPWGWWAVAALVAAWLAWRGPFACGCWLMTRMCRSPTGPQAFSAATVWRRCCRSATPCPCIACSTRKPAL